MRGEPKLSICNLGGLVPPPRWSEAPPMYCRDRLGHGKTCLRHRVGMEIWGRDTGKGESRFTGEGRTAQPHAGAADLHAPKRPPFSKSNKERPASKGRVHKGRPRN
jgi:hypothetical protein